MTNEEREAKRAHHHHALSRLYPQVAHWKKMGYTGLVDEINQEIIKHKSQLAIMEAEDEEVAKAATETTPAPPPAGEADQGGGEDDDDGGTRQGG